MPDWTVLRVVRCTKAILIPFFAAKPLLLVEHKDSGKAAPPPHSRSRKVFLPVPYLGTQIVPPKPFLTPFLPKILSPIALRGHIAPLLSPK
jgi:hypothetical protein